MLKRWWVLILFILLFSAQKGSAFSIFQAKPSASPQLFDQPLNSCKSYERRGEDILVDPDCILSAQLPQLTLQDASDAVWKNLKTLGTGYRSDLAFAVYTPEQLTLHPAERLYPLSQTRREALITAKTAKKQIQLPLALFGPLVVSDLAFFVADKDISSLKPCTKANYLLAFENLNGKIIKAGADFNFNHYLFGLRGYCEGFGGLDLKFYGGVCGVASQLFRAALTSPFVEVPMRWGHNERFSAYYGDKVQGDDAAVYETSKQLILKNTTASDLLIKTFREGEKTALVFISDAKNSRNKRVEIQKVYQSPLEVKLVKSVYQAKGKSTLLPQLLWGINRLWKGKHEVQELFSEQFISRYLGKNSSSR